MRPGASPAKASPPKKAAAQITGRRLKFGIQVPVSTAPAMNNVARKPPTMA